MLYSKSVLVYIRNKQKSQYHESKSVSKIVIKWCWTTDLNHRPTDYESVALPAELVQQ